MWWSDKKRLGGAASHEVEVIIVALEKKKKKIRKRDVYCLISNVWRKKKENNWSDKVGIHWFSQGGSDH